MPADLQPDATGDLPKLLVTQDFLDRQRKDRVQSIQRAADTLLKANAATGSGETSRPAGTSASTNVKEEEQGAPVTEAPGIPLPIAQLTEEARLRQAEHRKQMGEAHHKLLVSEGRAEERPAQEAPKGGSPNLLDTRVGPARGQAQGK